MIDKKLKKEFIDMKQIFKVLMLLGFVVTAYAATVEQQGEEILDQADREFYPFEGTMEMYVQSVQSDGSKQEYRMQVYKKGAINQTVVWTFPKINENDIGMRSGDTIYYKPRKATKPDIMSYQALFMSTGFSWGDVMSSDIALDYKAEKVEKVKENGKDCFFLQLKPVKEGLYARIDTWIDQTTFDCYKRVYYTASGDKLKIATYSEIKKENGVVASFRVDMEDYFQETKSYAIISNIKKEKLQRFLFDPQNIGRIHMR